MREEGLNEVKLSGNYCRPPIRLGGRQLSKPLLPNKIGEGLGFLGELNGGDQKATGFKGLCFQ